MKRPNCRKRPSDTFLMTVKYFLPLLVLALFISSCTTMAGHYRIPEDKSYSLGTGVRLAYRDDYWTLDLVASGKIRSGTYNEFYLEGGLQYFKLGSADPLASVTPGLELGWIRWFQENRGDGGSFSLGIPVLYNNKFVPDLKGSVHLLSLEGDRVLGGSVNTSVSRFFLWFTGEPNFILGAGKSGWGPFPLGIEFWGGFQNQGGGYLGTINADLVSPGISLEVFLLKN